MGDANFIAAGTAAVFLCLLLFAWLLRCVAKKTSYENPAPSLTPTSQGDDACGDPPPPPSTWFKQRVAATAADMQRRGLSQDELETYLREGKYRLSSISKSNLYLNIFTCCTVLCCIVEQTQMTQMQRLPVVLRESFPWPPFSTDVRHQFMTFTV